MENAKQYIELLSKQTVDMDEIFNHIENDLNTIYYMDMKGGTSMAVQSQSKYALLDTGVKSTGNKPLFISLLRHDNEFNGYCIVTPDMYGVGNNIKKHSSASAHVISENLKRFVIKYNAQHNINNTLPMHGLDNESEPVVTEIFTATELATSEETPDLPDEDAPVFRIKQNMFSDLADLKAQMLTNTFETDEGLDGYIKIIGCRAIDLVNAGKNEYYYINKLKSVIINTGILDKCGNDILLLYKWNIKWGTYKCEKQILSKADMVAEGFSREEIASRELQPIRFTEDEDCMPALGLSDFDINSRCLTHALEERRDRFPVSVQNCSTDILAEKMRESLNVGLKMLKRDATYAKPSYSTKLHGISWLLPLHVFNSMSEEPELVMAIRQNPSSGFYEIKTVMKYDATIRDRINCMTLYRKSW